MKKTINYKKQTLMWSLLINLLLIAGVFLVFHTRYENNDDVGVMIRALGAKGVYEPHLIYVNYVCGLILTFLYRTWHHLPWHALVQYALLFVSFTAFTYVVMKRAKHTTVVWLSFFPLCYAAYDGYVKLQYTKTAGIVSACGIFLVLYAVENERKEVLALLCGYILCGFGYMYRSTQFLAEGAFMTSIAVLLLLEIKKNSMRWGSVLRKYILACGGLLLCLGILYGIDKQAYSSPEWKEFAEFNELRTELFDYGFPSYQENVEAYEALGINENAYQLYREGNTMDPEKFSVETMRQIVALKHKKTINVQFFQRFLEKVGLGVFEIKMFYCFLILLAFRLLFWEKGNRQLLLILLYQAVLTIVVYLFMFYRGRFLLNRVEVGIWLAQCAVLLWTFSTEKPYLSKKQGFLLVLAFLCLAQLTSIHKAWRINAKDKSKSFKKERKLLETLQADQEHVYLAKMGTVSIFRSYDIYDEVPFGITANVFQFGGWSGRTPSELDIIHSYGIYNPYKDLINSDVAYLLDDKKGMKKTMKYIHDYYDPDAVAVKVANYKLCKVYRIESPNK